MKRVSIAWSHMKKEEKTRYIQQAQVDKKRYEKEMLEMQKWEETHGKRYHQ
jgi:HMG (high mobility group) box 5